MVVVYREQSASEGTHMSPKLSATDFSTIHLQVSQKNEELYSHSISSWAQEHLHMPTYLLQEY